MELYRYHTFLYSSARDYHLVEDLTFTDRKALAKCEVLTCCTYFSDVLQNLTLQVTEVAWNHRCTKKEVKKLLPVGGESVTQINYVMEKVNSKKLHITRITNSSGLKL